MDSLAHKRVLLVGNDVAFAGALAKRLQAADAQVLRQNCVVAADYAALELKPHDIVVITQLFDPGTHKEFLKKSSAVTDSTASITVFVRIDLEHDSVETVLASGASDFISDTDTIDDVVEKIAFVAAQNDPGLANTAIDLTPKKTTKVNTNTRVYVVEDDPLLRNLLRDKFEKAGLVAEFSANGDAIRAQLTAFKPNILLLDLMLPGRNGFDILKELKAHTETAHVPIVVFSNRDSREDRERAVKLGAVAFYIKAMTDLSELMTLIERHAT